MEKKAISIIALDPRAARSYGRDVEGPVSYTHLDVYKRQGQGRKLLQFEIGVCSHPVLVQDPQDLISAEAGNAQKQAEKEPAAPVSYTHLARNEGVETTT